MLVRISVPGSHTLLPAEACFQIRAKVRVMRKTYILSRNAKAGIKNVKALNIECPKDVVRWVSQTSC